MRDITVSAKTVNDAITEASIQLGVVSSELEYEVIEKGSTGFLGIGAKQAVIRAWKKEEPKVEPEIIEEVPEKEEIIIEQEQEEIILQVEEEKEQEQEEIVEKEEEKPQVKEPEIVFEEPKEEEEPVQTKSASVLDYLHNNIMKDNEPKQAKKEEYTTLDLFKSQPSIAEAFENKNRSDLRTAIGVSEKFMFINDLFSGDLKEYTNFINLLNDATSVELSMTVIEENRLRRKWIKESMAYTTLESLVQKRFKK